MEIQNKDFYAGFEGEPEIIFYYEDTKGRKVYVKLWIGYFDEMMTAIEPNDDGWKGLAFYYHTHSGWFEEKPWKIPDLAIVLDDLLGLNQSEFEQETRIVYQNILDFLLQAQLSNTEVWVEYN